MNRNIEVLRKHLFFYYGFHLFKDDISEIRAVIEVSLVVSPSRLKIPTEYSPIAYLDLVRSTIR